VSKGTYLAAAALLGAVLPCTALAQGVEFTPFFASYYALTPVNDDVDGSGTISERQTPAPAVGARLTIWAGGSLGFEAAGSFAMSGTRFVSETRGATGASFSLPGTLITASGRVLYRPARTNLHLLVGGGMITRGGDTWDFANITSKTTFGGVVGFGARAAVTPSFALNVSVESFLYSLNPDGAAAAYDPAFQADIYVAIGVPISFGGR
jgi:hypothetical protein